MSKPEFFELKCKHRIFLVYVLEYKLEGPRRNALGIPARCVHINALRRNFKTSNLYVSKYTWNMVYAPPLDEPKQMAQMQPPSV